MCIDHKNRLWLGTYFGGLNYFDGKKFHHFSHDPNNSETIADDRVWDIYKDHDNLLWIGTLQAGADLFNPETGKVVKHFYPQHDNKSVGALSVFTIIGDHNKNIWLATSKGFDFYDRKTGLFTHYLCDPANPNSLSNSLIYDIIEDSRGYIWAASGSGLNLLDPVSGKIRIFKTEHGLPSNYIVTLVEDNKGNIWMGTSNGISNLIISNHINIDSFDYSFKNYNESNGLQGLEFNENAVLKTKKGELIFGGGNGFNLFDPLNLNDDNVKSNTIITDFQIFNKSPQINEPFNGRVILQKSINYTKEITLKHYENLFSVEFSSLNFFHPEIRRYKYIMEGFNKQWLFTDAAHRKITYTNLNPGKYIFRVIATNNDGSWNQEEASLVIIILPPFWRTWWFQILVISALTGTIILVFFWRLNHLKKQKDQLEKKVANRTHEVEEKNKELIIQTNLLNESNVLLEDRQQEVLEQSEELLAQKEILELVNTNLQELNSTKDKFFSIIAHDLKSPFHNIIGFADLLEMSYDNLKNDKRKEYIRLISSSAKSVYNLLENLLNWAKSQTNQLNTDKSEIDLNDIFNETLAVLSESLKNKSISISVVQNTKRKIFADYQMISSIVRNLLNNAIKFTHQDGQINIISNEKDNMVQVDIIDNGTGISEEVKISLFTVGEFKTTVGTNGEIGSGLGLILCKEFIERNGGKIWVESVRDKGSTFSFTVPFA